MAVVDGVLFGWFLLIAHFAAGNLIQISEYIWYPKPEDLRPALTAWILAVYPEEPWSLQAGCLMFSVGFGLISVTSAEALASRLFRWAAIAVFTALLALAQPAMSAFKNLVERSDGRLWDEVLFVALSLAVLVYGIIRWRRFQHPQA